MQTHGGQEAEDAITGRERSFSARLMVDWEDDGQYNHPLSDMSRFISRASQNQSLTSSAPEEVQLIEGYAAGELEIRASGNYEGFPLSAHFAPYNSRSVFYAGGIPLGVQLTYEVAVDTVSGWEWYPQFTGIVREIETDRATGEVVFSCLDNAEHMRTPVTIPPYSAYRDYLVNGYKRSGLVDSSSVIDLAARAAGFDNSPRGYWEQHKTYQNANGTYGKKYVLSVPFHGSMLPEIGALDNDFEFHLTEDWENGTAEEQARAEQYRVGPDFAGNGSPYLACNAVPRGKSSQAVKKYWTEVHDYENPSAAWGTTVLGTWIYWTGQDVDESSQVMRIEYYDVSIELNVRSSDRGVYSILRTGKTEYGESYTDTHTGPLLFLPTEPGWNYIEAAVNIRDDTDALLQTKVNETTSNGTTKPYVLPQSSEYALNGLVHVHNTYALSDLFVFRNEFREFITNQDEYDFTSRGNVYMTQPGPDQQGWGRNRFMYTLRDGSQQSWDIVKEVAAAEYAVVFFDGNGDFRFWNYDELDSKQQNLPDRVFSLDTVENLSLKLTMDSVRNIWKITTTTAEAVPGISYDLAKDGVPRQETNTTLPFQMTIPNDEWEGFMVPDDDHVISTHPFMTRRPEGMRFDQYAPLEGFKTYNGGAYTNITITMFPRKSGPYWTKVVLYNASSAPQSFEDSDGRQFFRLQGTVIQENEPRTFEVRNEESVANYGQRVLEMSDSFWLQDRFQTQEMLDKLVAKFGRPIPVTNDISVPGDPRIQLGDVIEVQDPEGFGGSVKLQILGVDRELEATSGLTDTYKVEVIQSPGTWQLGDADYSIIGKSTILA